MTKSDITPTSGLLFGIMLRSFDAISFLITEGKKGKLGANPMKRVAAGAHLPTPWFLCLRNAQTIEPTTAWTALEWSGARPMGEQW